MTNRSKSTENPLVPPGGYYPGVRSLDYCVPAAAVLELPSIRIGAFLGALAGAYAGHELAELVNNAYNITHPMLSAGVNALEMIGFASISTPIGAIIGISTQAISEATLEKAVSIKEGIKREIQDFRAVSS